MIKWLNRILLFLFLSAIFLVVISYQAYKSTLPHIVNRVDNLKKSSYGLILGASVQPNKLPSAVLRDRIDTAMLLLEFGKVDKLLLSGDSDSKNYNEVLAMQKRLKNWGISDDKMLIDAQGSRTFESCRRAKELYHVNDMVIVTQKFHLPRAIFLCSSVGISAQGFIADRSTYIDVERFYLREIFAWILAVIDIGRYRTQILRVKWLGF